MEFSQESPLNADEVITMEEAVLFPRMEDIWPAAALVALSDQERETVWQEVSCVTELLEAEQGRTCSLQVQAGWKGPQGPWDLTVVPQEMYL